jgi:hypothetical protein
MTEKLLTPLEEKILDKTSELWNLIITLSTIHPSHNKEYEFLIHLLQDKIMSRPVIISLKGNND